MWYLFSPLDQLSVGAQADSAHEYLLKLYLLTGKTDKASLEMCTSMGHLFGLPCIYFFLARYPSNDKYHHASSIPFSGAEPALCNRHI